jgi:hypothetical protein
MTDTFRALCEELIGTWEVRYGLGFSNFWDKIADIDRRARTALAQPEPQGPTGRPAIEPVPVSERLPGPEDCDEKGRCWWFSPPACGPNTIRPCWTFDSETLEGDTHWLPHWALPVPGVEAANG